MKTIYIGLMGLFLALGNTGLAQTHDIDFVLTSTSMHSEGVELHISSAITKSGNTLSWVQEADGNNSQKNFIIDGVSGDWDEESSTGNITYTATLNGHQIRLSLIGNATDGLSSTLEILQSAQGDETFIVNVTNLTYQ